MALLNREHSILVEWLCSAEGAATITGVLGKDAYEIARDRRLWHSEPLGQRPLGASVWTRERISSDTSFCFCDSSRCQMRNADRDSDADT